MSEERGLNRCPSRQTNQKVADPAPPPPILQSLDGPIPANQFADSRESPASRESFQGSRSESLFCESRFGGLKSANRRFEAIRANRSHVMIFIFLRVGSRESPRFALRITRPSISSKGLGIFLKFGVLCSIFTEKKRSGFTRSPPFL